MLVNRKHLTAAVAMFVKMRKRMHGVYNDQILINCAVVEGTGYLRMTMCDLKNEMEIVLDSACFKLHEFMLDPFELSRALKVVKLSDVSIVQASDSAEHWEIGGGVIAPQLYGGPPSKEHPASRLGYTHGGDQLGIWDSPALLRKHLENALVSASEDETRYILNGIFMDAKEQMFVSTDGNRLTAIPADPSSTVQLETRRFKGDVIHTSAVKLLIDAIKAFGAGDKTRVLGEARGGRDGKNSTRMVRFNIIGEGVTFGLTARTIDGDFPPWRSVVPRAGKDQDPKARTYMMMGSDISAKIDAVVKALGVSRNAICWTFLTESASTSWIDAEAYIHEARKMSLEKTGTPREKGYRALKLAIGERKTGKSSGQKMSVSIRYLAEAIGKKPGLVSMTLYDNESPVRIDHEDGRICIVMPVRL